MPPLYHWSPVEHRESIKKRGLRPSCPTMRPIPILPPVKPGARRRHLGDVPGEESALMVCLGLSPSHAWSLSGSIWSPRGSVWDLWQVVLDDDDFVYPLPFLGHRLEEVRVGNRIPKSQVWYVASRTVQERGPR